MLIQIDPENMSNEELSFCVDEFVKRSMQTLRDTECEQSFAVTIVAAAFSDVAYDIKHMARIGSEYGGGITRETNNLMLSAARTASAWLEDQENKPTKVNKLIEAPIEQSVEQPPVQDNNVDEDIPF